MFLILQYKKNVNNTSIQIIEINLFLNFAYWRVFREIIFVVLELTFGELPLFMTKFQQLHTEFSFYWCSPPQAFWMV